MPENLPSAAREQLVSFSDFNIRFQVLSLAHNNQVDSTAEAVVTRARKYMKFLAKPDIEEIPPLTPKV